jgi:hypothetical protein
LRSSSSSRSCCFSLSASARRKQVKRLESVSDERRQRAQQHGARAAQLEQELERERVHADQHSSAAREAEEKLAEKR